jgi:hypothetical protein
MLGCRSCRPKRGWREQSLSRPFTRWEVRVFERGGLAGKTVKPFLVSMPEITQRGTNRLAVFEFVRCLWCALFRHSYQYQGRFVECRRCGHREMTSDNLT